MTYISTIKKNGENILLYKSNEPVPELLLTSDEYIKIGFIDTETTGINRQTDKIIELAIKVIKIEKSSGKIISIEDSYESFNDPHEKLDQKITQLTGITNKMLNGKEINWTRVNEILNNTDLIVAHNASFDRAFIDRESRISSNSVWACSVRDIDWLSRGFPSSKQELLCHWHGFYFVAHRAMNDVDALIHLLTHKHYDLCSLQRPVTELINNSAKQSYTIFADNFSYNAFKKDKIKNNGYRWNNKEKIWRKKVDADELDDEKRWLAEAIYDDTFKGRVEKLNIIDKYKT